MTPYELIKAKRDGERLPPEEIRAFLTAFGRGEVPDYQMAALCMAVVFRGLAPDELRAWTEAMLHSGEVLDLSQLPAHKVDKHSTGGVGDKVSLCLAPLVAACGVCVPMISGRGLGHTGGTLDKLQSIPGFRVDLELSRARHLLGELGVVLMGQTATIAPADRRLYALRDVTATVDCIPLIASSILSKKLAEDLDGLVLDVKVGSGAFMKTRETARTLARTMVELAGAMGCRSIAWLTSMEAPLGTAVGNALEVVEAIDVLRGHGPSDVRELTLTLGAEMLVLGGRSGTQEDARMQLERALSDGRGLERLVAIISAQGGDARVVDAPNRLPTASAETPVSALRGGWVQHIDTEAIGLAAVSLGAGRLRAEDAVDPAVGFTIEQTLGREVEQGEPLVRIHHHPGQDVARLVSRIQAAYRLGNARPPEQPLLLERIV